MRNGSNSKTAIVCPAPRSPLLKRSLSPYARATSLSVQPPELAASERAAGHAAGAADTARATELAVDAPARATTRAPDVGVTRLSSPTTPEIVAANAWETRGNAVAVHPSAPDARR